VKFTKEELIPSINEDFKETKKIQEIPVSSEYAKGYAKGYADGRAEALAEVDEILYGVKK
jgi:flagellar biosynthesis/type III secretory pathway protein FliH